MCGNAPHGGAVEPTAMTADNPLSLWYRDQDSTFWLHGGRRHRVHRPIILGIAATSGHTASRQLPTGPCIQADQELSDHRTVQW